MVPAAYHGLFAVKTRGLHSGTIAGESSERTDAIIQQNQLSGLDRGGVGFAIPSHDMGPDDSLPKDRRDRQLRDAIVHQIQHELQHLPGLALTREQMSRLFNIPQDACGRLLATLVDQGVICVRADGRFVAASRT